MMNKVSFMLVFLAIGVVSCGTVYSASSVEDRTCDDYMAASLSNSDQPFLFYATGKIDSDAKLDIPKLDQHCSQFPLSYFINAPFNAIGDNNV